MNRVTPTSRAASSLERADAASFAGDSPPPVPDYELLRRIGGGSYGEVWLARSATGVLRAVKIVWRHTFEDERPFQREFEGIQSFERLSREHPSQLALFHVGRGDGYFYYVIELADDANADCGMRSAESQADIPGSTPNSTLRTPHSYAPHTLRHEFQAHGRLPCARVLEIAVALTEGLAHLHEHGLVHRDIKPSNIIFVNGRPKLADIGLVTDAGDAQSIVGTEGYLAPEGPGTPQADIFALGKVLYEAVTGMDRRQFPQLPPDLREWPDARLLFELNETLLKACAPNARERYAGAEAMREELKSLQAGQSVKRQRAWQRTWSCAKKIVLAVGALAVVAAAAYWLSSRQPRPSEAVPSRPPEFVWSTSELANEEFLKGLRSLQADRNNAQAIQHFKRAIELDPNFAEAYARLAWAHYSFGAADPNPEEGPAAAEKAVELNPILAYGHSMLATARAAQLKWAEADRERREAIRLNPNSQEILLESALNLACMGKTNEALRDLKNALRADPGSASNMREGFYGLVYGWCRQYEKALKIYGASPSPTGSYFDNQHRALMNLGAGNFTNFMRCSKQALLSPSENPTEVNTQFDALDKAFQQGGQQAYWKLSLEFESSRRDKDHFMRMAAIHAQLNQSKEAFHWLRQAMKEAPIWFSTGLYTNPSFDSLRTNEQFAVIEKELWQKN